MNDAILENDLIAATPVAAQNEQAAHDNETISPKGVALILAVVAAFLAAVGAGVATFGLPVLGLTALAAVPVIYVALILLTVGK